MWNSRRVHLDFHTSEHIEDIGAKFDKRVFQNTLTKAHITQITLFAKCHHGWCYFPTKVGVMHPNLAFDLLGAQIEACKEVGIKVVVYITGGWSVNDAAEHPEWQAVSFDTGEKVYMEEGQIVQRKPHSISDAKPTCAWDLLCLAGGYKRHILELTAEICERYPQIDGLFYDICCLDVPCICDSCKAGMKARGYDVREREDVMRYMIEQKIEFMNDCRSVMQKTHPHGSIFFNSGGAEISHPFYADCMTHFELEDLPTVSGYDNIYNRAKFFSKKGKDVVGMTGKFRHTWGEFGSFKKAEALKYECAAMLALGMKCSVGDQLHPNGLPDPYTYEIIGEAFGYVEKIEKFCYGCESAARLGLVLSDNYAANEGISAMLLESGIDYEIAGETEDLNALYDCIILADGAALSPEFSGKLKVFQQNGGALAVIGTAGLAGEDFCVPTCVKYVRGPRFDIDYIVPGEKIYPFGLRSPLLVYRSAHIVQETDETEILAHIEPPYFSRTTERYCSHRNTPNRTKVGQYPAICKRGDLLYFAHDFGTIYHKSGDPFLREVFVKALKTVYKPVFEMEGFLSAGRARLVKRGRNAFLHLLYAPPLHRGNVIILEDFPVLQNIKVRIRNMRAASVCLRPDGEKLAFENKEDGLYFVLPQMRCHALIDIETE